MPIYTKKRVHHWVIVCAFELNGMPTSSHLNAIPLGSYIMLLSMDWLYLHRTKVDCYKKGIECLDDDGEKRILQGKKKSTLVRMVTTMHGKRNYKEGRVLFAVHVSSDKGKDVEVMEVLKRYLIF